MNQKIPDWQNYCKTRKQIEAFKKDYRTLCIVMVCIINAFLIPLMILFGVCYMVVAFLNFIFVYHPCIVCKIDPPCWSKQIEDFDKKYTVF